MVSRTETKVEIRGKGMGFSYQRNCCRRFSTPNYRNATGPSKFFGDAVVRDGFADHDGRSDCTALQIPDDCKPSHQLPDPNTAS